MERQPSESTLNAGATTTSETTILVVAVFLAALLIRLVCYTGLIASDDLGYSYYALGIARGTYQLEAHHYAIRYALLLPVAAFYGLFGAHVWTSIAWTLLSNSAACVLVAIIARRYGGAPAAWIAGLLLATFPIEVRYATMLVPEPAAELPILAGALLFLQARDRASLARGLAAGSCFGLAYLTKESAVFVAAAFFVFALTRRRWDLALQLAAGSAAVVAVELLWYWSQAGDLLFRPHAMAVHNNSVEAVAANADLSYRIWKAYPRMMLVPGIHFGLHSIFALAIAAIGVVWYRLKGDVLLLVLWAALPFLYLDFGSSSFTRYWALPLAPRYISLIYPPLFILGAMTLVSLWSRRRELRWASVAATAVVCLVGVGAAYRTRASGYGTDTVRRLKGIAVAAHAEHRPICVTRADSIPWHQVLGLLDANLGCDGGSLVRLRMDSAGRPLGVPSETVPPAQATDTLLPRPFP